MTLQEKELYHQIHPLKLITDWVTGLISLYPRWQNDLVTGLIIPFVPSIVVSLLLIRFAHLEKYRDSRFGRYVSKYMTRAAEAVRFAGYGATALGAWFHLIWLMPLGLLVIVVLGFFLLNDLHRKNYGFAFVEIGVLANCLPVVYSGIVSMLRGEKGIGLAAMLKSLVRGQAKQKYPHMLTDTITLLDAVIIRFLGLSVVLLETVSSGKNHRVPGPDVETPARDL